MNRSIKAIAVAAALAVASVTTAGMAQAQAPATSLQELLDRVREGRASDNAENRQREQQFRQQRAEQARLLAEAQEAVRREEARSDRLENEFDEKERELAQLEQQLQERLGAFGELFGVVRQVAGDMRGQLRQSLISAQLPGRDAPIDDLAQLSQVQLPEMSDLINLWSTMVEEAVEQGKVVRFTAPVVTVDGVRSEKSVVRVGPFNAIADGKFVQYLTETEELTELGRQPVDRFTSTAQDLQGASAGITNFAIDPSRGALLGLLVQSPSLNERIQQGGLPGYVILVLLAIGLLLAFWRIIALTLTGTAVSSQRKKQQADSGNPLGRIMMAYQENQSQTVENLQLKLDDAILKEIPKLETGLSTIKVLAAISPMLGLLGTVTGMIETFQAITLFGTGDPKMMAGGISQALITTVLGLVAAIPLILLHSIAAGRSKAVIEVLEEQSAGIVAAHAENR